MISAAQPIPLSDAQLIAITQSCYGFVPQIQRLPGEYDTNAVVMHPDGHRFVLKIMLGEMSIEVLKSTTVSAQKIQDTGFVFDYPEISKSLSTLDL